jgi:hypothetical protein
MAQVIEHLTSKGRVLSSNSVSIGTGLDPFFFLHNFIGVGGVHVLYCACVPIAESFCFEATC